MELLSFPNNDFFNSSLLCCPEPRTSLQVDSIHALNKLTVPVLAEIASFMAIELCQCSLVTSV